MFSRPSAGITPRSDKSRPFWTKIRLSDESPLPNRRRRASKISSGDPNAHLFYRISASFSAIRAYHFVGPPVKRILERARSPERGTGKLWADCLTLEKMWREGKLDHVVQMDKGEAEIARMQPWRGSPALAASDCLFSFGAHISDT